jgi:hypothetical protein
MDVVNLNLIMVFFNPVYVYIFVFMLRNTRTHAQDFQNKIKLGHHCTRHSESRFLSVWCMMTNLKCSLQSSFIITPKNSVELEMFLCVNGSSNGFCDKSHTC